MNELFNSIANHLITQGRPSIGSFGRCLYRGADGAKCAVGFLIPDEDYNPEWDKQGLGVFSLATMGYLSSVPTAVLPMLNKLQQAHDDPENHLRNDNDEAIAFDLPALKAALNKIAADFDINADA